MRTLSQLRQSVQAEGCERPQLSTQYFNGWADLGDQTSPVERPVGFGLRQVRQSSIPLFVLPEPQE